MLVSISFQQNLLGQALMRLHSSPSAFLSKLKKALIYCRDGSEIVARIKLYDKHFNLVIVDDKGKERFIRGDSIISIANKSSIHNKVAEQHSPEESRLEPEELPTRDRSVV